MKKLTDTNMQISIPVVYLFEENDLLLVKQDGKEGWDFIATHFETSGGVFLLGLIFYVLLP